MSKLKLGLIEDDTPVKVTVELPAALHRDLLDYGKLIVPMVGRFMESDRGFTRGRKARKT